MKHFLLTILVAHFSVSSASANWRDKQPQDFDLSPRIIKPVVSGDEKPTLIEKLSPYCLPVGLVAGFTLVLISLGSCAMSDNDSTTDKELLQRFGSLSYDQRRILRKQSPEAYLILNEAAHSSEMDFAEGSTVETAI